MYISPEDARSDVILAAATTVFGGLLVRVLTGLPLYPRSGIVVALLDAGWVFVLTGLVPLLLARYRGDGIAAFGLDRSRSAWRSGLLVALPIAVVGVLTTLTVTQAPYLALLGRFGRVASGPGIGVGVLLVEVASLVALSVGSLLLVGFLTTRGRDAFRSTEVSLTELVRTFGMGAAVVALAAGTFRLIGGASLLGVLLPVMGLAVVVLLADRLVASAMRTARTAVVTPVVVVAAVHVFAAGGLLRGGLFSGMYAAALGAGVATVMAVLLESRWRAWAVVPIAVAAHWWPGCLSPLAFQAC